MRFSSSKDTSASKEQQLLSTVLGHTKSLGSRRLTPTQLEIEALFLSNLFCSYERPCVKSALQPLVCEALVKIPLGLHTRSTIEIEDFQVVRIKLATREPALRNHTRMVLVVVHGDDTSFPNSGACSSITMFLFTYV